MFARIEFWKIHHKRRAPFEKIQNQDRREMKGQNIRQIIYFLIKESLNGIQELGQ